MKRKILLFLFISFCSAQILQAQITKGSWFLGGSLGFSSAKISGEATTTDVKLTTFHFSPALGKVTKDNFVVGGELNLSGYNNRDNPDSYNKQTNIGASVFVRKYVELLNKFYLFGHGRFGLGYINEDSKNPDRIVTARGYSIALALYPGISYAIKKKMHFEMSLNNLASINFIHRKYETYYYNFSNFHSTSDEFSLGSNVFSQSGLWVGIRFFM